MLSDNFVMSMAGVESKKFSELIDYSTLDSGNQALCSMMFADYQLDTKMDIGFVGSPNIGSVALNQLKDSEEFKQFSNVFRKEDRIFVVSSIFGGTGAAGYPIIVKNIRNAAANSAINNRGDLRSKTRTHPFRVPISSRRQSRLSTITTIISLVCAMVATTYPCRKSMHATISATRWQAILTSTILVVAGSATMLIWWSM